MEEKEEIVLFVDELESELAIGIPFCRICHEIEFESCKSLEAPCSCSGTLKFAHRDCTQRWCDEKGNTVCEICLQNFEPGYSVPIEKAQLLGAPVTIRGRLEVPRRESGQENTDLNEQLLQHECSSEAVDWHTNCLKVLAVIATVLLLTRHLVTLLTDVTKDYPFLLTLLIEKTCGIVLPICAIIIAIITLIHNIFRNRHLHENIEDEVSNSESTEDEEHDQDHVVEVDSSSS